LTFYFSDGTIVSIMTVNDFETEGGMTTTQYPVLVYGTLRPGCGNYNAFLAGNTVLEQDVAIDGFDMYTNGGFPYLVDGDSTVTATLVYLDSENYDETMQGLDFLEGFHGEGSYMNHYDRRLLKFTVDGLDRQAWIYIASEHTGARVRETLPLIEHGDWLRYKDEGIYA
jgi:gamma-glutamylcyclotransferase (GGCT)/AIG2-like uncharacterized protein YtfP